MNTDHCIVKRTLVVNFWLLRSGNLPDQAMEDFTTGHENIVAQSAVLRWKYRTEILTGIHIIWLIVFMLGLLFS